MQRRFMRSGDVQALARRVSVPAQAGRMVRKRHSLRQPIESAIGGFKHIFKRDFMAQKEDVAGTKLARKTIIYNSVRR